MLEKKVNLFIAGTQKGGTTALHSKLKDHPEIFLSRKKELHFFDKDDLDWRHPPYDILHKHFDFTRGHVFGEATPIYIYWPNSIRRMFQYNPDAKIIIILRHPAFRALSAWKMEKARGAERLSFGLAVSKLGRLRVKLASGGVHRIYSYVERGYYAHQIAQLLEYFPREQVLFLTSDQLWNNEHETLTRICSFLKVDPARIPAGTNRQKYVVPVDSSHILIHSHTAMKLLGRHFREEIARTAEITGLDLNHWFNDDYLEPMQTHASQS